MNSQLNFLIDLAVFQIAWFACVLATLSSFPYALPISGLALVVARVLHTRRLKKVLPFLLICGIFGIFGDAILIKFEFLSFSPYPNLWGTPLWMVALWLNFGLMLHPVFSWFIDNCKRAVIGFSAGGVVAYYAGQKLEVITLEKGWQSALAISTEWAIAGFILHYFEHRSHGERAS